MLTVQCAHCIGLWPGSLVPLQRDVDIYGFRSQDERVFYLSPWELRTFWYAEALHAPDSVGTYQMTRWRSQAAVEVSLSALKETPPEGTFLAGVHYELNEEFCLAQQNICIFPDTVQTAKFRHQWILKPRDRPVDPCPQGTPLPKKGMAPEEKARLCSVYMRPWTLINEFATAAVPHLRNLNVVQQTQQRLRRRLRSKTSVEPSYEYCPPVRSWRKSWRQRRTYCQ